MLCKLCRLPRQHTYQTRNDADARYLIESLPKAYGTAHVSERVEPQIDTTRETRHACVIETKDDAATVSLE